MKSISSRIKYTGLALAMVSTLAAATVTFDPLTGLGFVGKGDVQYTYGFNNAQIQAASLSVRFRAKSTLVTEQTWECTKVNNGNETVQVRSRTTTTDTDGLVTTIARERNQFTGFILNGWNGDTSTTISTDGPALNTCPAPPPNNPSDPFVLTSPAGDPVVVAEESGDVLEVSKDTGATWQLLLEKPAPVL